MNKEFNVNAVNEEFKKILIEEGFSVFKIADIYNKINKSLLIYVFFLTDFELNRFLEEQKVHAEELYNDLLKKINISFEVKKVYFYFKSDEGAKREVQALKRSGRRAKDLSVKKDYDSVEINNAFKNILNEEGASVYKIIDLYAQFNKSLLIYIYFLTDLELNRFSDEQRNHAEKIYIDLLKNNNIIPTFIEQTEFHWDSDENVQKNYGGNYFYATR